MSRATKGKSKGVGRKVSSASIGSIMVELEEIDLADLKQDHANARKHGPRGLGEVGDSLQSVGPARSLVIHKGRIIAGNLTHEAALERGFRKAVRVRLPPGVVLVNDRSDLTAAKAAEAGIRDNRSAEAPDTGWDMPVLDGLAEEHALDLGALGFTEAELEALRDGEPAATEDLEERGGGGGCKHCPEHCGTE